LPVVGIAVAAPSRVAEAWPVSLRTAG
jgi:hypothetical protein